MAETLGQRLMERLSITQAMLDDNERLRAEIARLREAICRLADQDATLSVCNGNVTVTMDAAITAEEREAVQWCLSLPMLDRDAVRMMPLRKLLERLGGAT